ncbi:hypothetical protein [Mucilaginibacter sp.]|uniref:hypothetical protein n=1 Tax=Mucilaginibacter sp. TaxID=1882438 RepID=UPI003265021A
MNLGFTEKIDNKPNFFVEKIWKGLVANELSDISTYQNYRFDYNEKFNRDWDDIEWEDCREKRHTIREFWKNKTTGLKANKQWQAGNLIHPVIGNRSPNHFQFAPAIPCTGLQMFETNNRFGHASFEVLIDGGIFAQLHYGHDEDVNAEGLYQLAINDGFETLEGFVNYFPNFKGQIIHWTNNRY